MYATPEQGSYPACEQHYPDLLKFWMGAHPGIPIEVDLYDAYDKEDR